MTTAEVNSVEENMRNGFHASQTTEDAARLTEREAWRLFGIMSEFVEATDRLSEVRPAVSIFGSARVLPDSPYYQLAETIAKRLSDAGLGVISGGGPGIMEAANKGAFGGNGPSIGLNIELPHEQHTNPYQDISLGFRHLWVWISVNASISSSSVPKPPGITTYATANRTNMYFRAKKCRNPREIS